MFCAVPMSELSAVKSSIDGVAGECVGVLPDAGVNGAAVLGVILLSMIGRNPFDQSSSGDVVATCTAFGFQTLLQGIIIDPSVVYLWVCL